MKYSHCRAAFQLLISQLIIIWIITGCGLLNHSELTPLPPTVLPRQNTELSPDENATLDSLEQVDDYPLYTMQYKGAYPDQASSTNGEITSDQSNIPASEACQLPFGCSLFTTLGDSNNRLYGRNFDWEFSPALLLFTDPADGYASVSMVDIAYLDFSGDLAHNVTELPLIQRISLLKAPLLPFDGMNEQGLAVGMAAVPPGEMRSDRQKKTLDQLMVIREILDHASTVDEAINILGSYNIDMGSVPLHYLIASATGNSALVEFYKGKMVVFRNESPWQVATNFLVASTGGQPQGQCPRYDRLTQQLTSTGGQLTIQEAFRLLNDVSQDITQWSVVYEMTSGDINIIMGRKYTDKFHTLHLNLAKQ